MLGLAPKGFGVRLLHSQAERGEPSAPGRDHCCCLAIEVPVGVSSGQATAAGSSVELPGHPFRQWSPF